MLLMPQTPHTDAVVSLSDEVVVARVLAGERQLFELLMRRYNRRIFRVVRSIVRDDLEAEDVAQEAWVRAYDHLGSFEGRALFSTWVTRIGVHEALARVRRARRQEPMDLDDVQEVVMSAGTPEQHASDGELRRVIEEAVDELPEHYRTVFMMRTVEGMPVSDTAECLGITEETVKTRAFRARALLQRAIGARLDSVAAGAFDFLGVRCDRIVARVLARIGASDEQGGDA
jgi:RNA polymerase sigma-70 factor (ECF subfamily)